MNLSEKDGGLPPDSVVQDEETILADSERVLKLLHDPRPGAQDPGRARALFAILDLQGSDERKRPASPSATTAGLHSTSARPRTRSNSASRPTA